MLEERVEGERSQGGCTETRQVKVQSQVESLHKLVQQGPKIYLGV